MVILRFYFTDARDDEPIMDQRRGIDQYAKQNNQISAIVHLLMGLKSMCGSYMYKNVQSRA